MIIEQVMGHKNTYCYFIYISIQIIYTLTFKFIVDCIYDHFNTPTIC
jgi:hypothetical protein